MRYLDKDSNEIYTEALLHKMWTALPEDIKQDYRKDGINNFNEWLNAATDMSGCLQIID